MMNTLKDRLNSGSKQNDATGCIEWKRHCNADGYGMLWLDRKVERTHRAAWIAAHGQIPEGMHVLHKCDNRKCINPDHLFIGTNADNVADKVAKNRQARKTKPPGEASGSAKLNTAKVQAIRIWLQAGLSYSKVAAKYCVHVQTIAAIKQRRSWAHL